MRPSANPASQTNQRVVRQVINVVVLISVLIVNGLSESLPIGGNSTVQIVARYNIYFLPAGYVFSIWGLIYAALIGFTIYQALPSQRDNPLVERIGWLFVLTGIGNIGWLFAFHYLQFALSEVPMLLLLAALIAIYTRLNIGIAKVSRREWWLLHFPFSLYLGWISVATIANTTFMLFDAKWNGFGISADTWGVIMLIIGAALAAIMVVRRGDVTFAFVVAWAFAGVLSRFNLSGPSSITTTAGILALICVVLAVGYLVTRRLTPSARTPAHA